MDVSKNIQVNTMGVETSISTSTSPSSTITIINGHSIYSPWRDHSKHIFVLTAAGKPVFSRFGSEAEQTRITSLITAVVARSLDTADPIHVMNAGDTLYVFSLRGPFVLLAISRTGETVHSLTQQLRSIHSAILMSLTGRIESRLAERPNLDIRKSIQSSRTHIYNLIRIANRYPTTWLDALPILTLTPSIRTKVTSLLANASARCDGIVYAMLITTSYT